MEQSHVLNLVICGSDSTEPVTAAGQTVDSYADFDDGAFSVTNDQNVVLSAASVLTDDRVALHGIKLMGRYGTSLVQTDLIRVDDVISFRGIADAAAAEQVTHIGYNGSSGAIEMINSNTYKIKLNFYEQGRTGQGQHDFISAFYESDASAVGGEVVFGIEKLLRLACNKQAERPVKFAILNSAALDTNLDFDHAVTVVNGSNWVTVATDLGTDGGVVEAAVGDFIRLGSATETDAAVALGSAVYKIEEISGLNLKLDRPVTGVSGSYTASTDAQLIQAATANAASWGIRCTGIARTHTVGKRPYSKVHFTVGLEDFGTTTVVYTTAMSLGSGTPEQIADLEYFTEGQHGYKYRGDYMYYPAYTSRVTSTSMYDQITLTWTPGSRVESIGGPGHNPKQLIIALDTLYDDNDANDIITDVIDAWLNAAFAADTGLGV